MLTPYQFASNTPIQAIDLDGLEAFYSSDGMFLGKFGKSKEIRLITDDNIKSLLLDYPNIVSFEYLMKNSEKLYRSEVQAAIDFAYKYQPTTHVENENANNVEWKVKSHRNRKERGAKIFYKIGCNEDGEYVNLFVLGSIVWHEKGQAPLDQSTFLSGWKSVSAVHSHPLRGGEFEGEEFSEHVDPYFPMITGDKFWSEESKLDLYLVTPQGYLKKYLFETGEVEIISDDIPYHPFSDRKNSKKPSFFFNWQNGKHVPIPKFYDTPEFTEKNKSDSNE